MVCPCRSPLLMTRGVITASSVACRLANSVIFQSRFLLKYASRDEIELLGRGTGGIVEVRNEIAQYEEKSPLYGFLRYRRRNVIIKYLPDDCSRLVQGLFHDPSILRGSPLPQENKQERKLIHSRVILCNSASDCPL